MVTPHTLRISGRYIVPRPLTLSQLSQRLECSLEEARTLAGVHRFPHAFIDREGKWRIPVADVDAYIRRSTVRGAPEGGVIEDLYDVQVPRGTLLPPLRGTTPARQVNTQTWRTATMTGSEPRDVVSTDRSGARSCGDKLRHSDR
jgi:hypothetical protein